MKKTHIFAILIIAAAVAIIITMTGSAGTYMNFTEAQALHQKGSSKLAHVVGQLKKDAQGNVVGIEKAENNMSFSFVLIDDEGTEQQVVYNEPMPADFKRSEQVVIKGNYNDNGHLFVAKEILLKCPSKYQETELQASSN